VVFFEIKADEHSKWKIIDTAPKGIKYVEKELLD
jgi:hypothetical protein